jgi:hypothetical protein
MIQAFLENHFQKNPISDAKLREEYDRQRKLIGEGASATQYRLSQIIGGPGVFHDGSRHAGRQLHAGLAPAAYL